MNWDTYRTKFTKEALSSNYRQDEIDEYLRYGKKLFDKKLPIIYDQHHLSLLVGYKEEYLHKISNSSNNFYRTFKIPKKVHGERIISEPLPSLKEIQQWILKEVLYKCKTSGYAKAYKPHYSIRNNAEFHINKPIVLTIDIKDFFPSLKWHEIYQFFLNLGYAKDVAIMLSNLCCLNGSLPQGAPTSPALSNLLMINIDKRISGFIKKYGINYTRYADDMTFSGNFEPGMILKFVNMVLSDNNLKVNERKTRVRRPNQRQEVTGITVNNKMQVSRNLRRQFRQSVYYIKKYGLSSHLEKTENLKTNHIKHLIGIANFIIFVNPDDNETIENKEFLIENFLVQ